MTSDVDLLARSRADPSAFDVIYERHARKLHSYLARRVGSVAAEDLLSEVFVRAIEARRRSKPHLSGSALPWLYGIARNVIYEHTAAHRRPQYVEPSPGFEWSTVDAKLDAAALGPDLRRALSALSGAEREVLLLVSWEQLTVTEAAEALGIRPGAARTRLHRARTRAAEALASTPHPYQSQEI